MPKRVRGGVAHLCIIAPGCIIAKCTLFFVLRFALSQAEIAAQTLTLMQGSEEKE